MKKISDAFQLQKRLPIFGLFLSLGAFIVFISMMVSPSDPQNAVFLGYSLERVLLLSGFLVVTLTIFFLSLYLFHTPERSSRIWSVVFQQTPSSYIVLALAIFIFFFLLFILFAPAYQLGQFSSYVLRLFPVVIWLFVADVSIILIMFFEKKGLVIEKRVNFKSSLVVFIILAVIAVFISVTGIGIRYPQDYWYGTGVPILGLQILLSLFIGVVALLFEKRLRNLNEQRLDVFVFVTIWVISALFWAREPISPNYFMPDTADNIIYPYSDGATFDVGAQYALIGEGLFNRNFFERVFYSIFMLYLHMFLGQDFEIIMSVQAALFAVLPAVGYLIGKEIHGRALGLSIGLLLAFRGVNAIIAARWIDTASPKMTLTDFPTAIGISIFLLFLIKWLKTPSKPTLLIWAGAVFALTFMVRSNVLTLLPVVLIFFPFVRKINWKQFILAGLLILLGIFTVTLPWEIRNQSNGIPMYSMYYSRILTILKYRYNIGADAYLPSQVTKVINVKENDAKQVSVRQRVFLPNERFSCDTLPCNVVNHFLHNVVTSFVSLPTSLVFDDIWNTVKADTPYWKSNWNDGTLGTLDKVMIFINLVVVSLGVGATWNRSRTLSLLPIVVFVIYLLTNSLGLTSGGRYIAPVDWIVYLYFIAGILQLSIYFLRAVGIQVEENILVRQDEWLPSEKSVFSNVFPTLAIVLVIGLLLPASELFYQPRYQVRQPEDILSGLERAGAFEQTEFSRADLEEFLSQPAAMIREGRALYPRYYPAGDGEQDRSTYYRYLDYQRLVFTLIGPYAESAEGVVIPGYPPPLPMHAEDVIVLGCWNTTYYAPFIDAVIVFVTSGDGYVYTRSPGAPLQCPLPEPKQ